MCLLFDIPLPLSFVRNHTRTCAENGEQVTTSGGYIPFAVAVADVNKDNQPDILVANWCTSYSHDTHSSCVGDGLVGVLLNNGDETFQAAVPYDSGGYFAVSIAVADLNADGEPDIIVANCTDFNNCSNTGSVDVLLGNGDGTFQKATPYSAGYQALGVTVADVNGDGKPDLLIADCSDASCVEDSSDSSVGVMLGNGDGSFQPIVYYASGGYFSRSVAVADVNGDGKLDLIVTNDCADTTCATDGTLGVLLGSGDGTFQTAIAYDSGGRGGSYSVQVADVNLDGKPDLMVANSCGSTCSTDGAAGVLIGNGDGTFKSVIAYDSGAAYAESLAVADVNGDGKPDLVVLNYCVNSTCENGTNDEGLVGILLGNGDGTFQTAVIYNSGGYESVSIIGSDVNEDGKPDLLVTNGCSYSVCGTDDTVSILINTSIGQTTASLNTSQNPSAFGQSVTFTVTVSPQGFKGTPSGTVTFFDGTGNLGRSDLNSNGVATLSTSTLTVGTHNITASYSEDANYAPRRGRISRPRFPFRSLDLSGRTIA